MRPRRYKLLIARRFQKDLHRLQPQERLAENPYMGEKVVAAATGQYRYRVGDYRIRYDIAGDEAHILRVRHRREVYREE